ncbi:MAG: SAM-dependent methyltransferase [Bacteroidales bacterium]|jgi:hypothetical protein|nr:SAM-dependent methyltransferase [Bacteroidales bacterium]
MSFSKKTHFLQNLAAIERVLSPQHTVMPEAIEILKKYTGFGALKCVLLPAETEEDKRHWSKSELELFPLVQELHRIVRNNTGNEQEYKEHINSIKNSVLTAFYTPTEIVKTVAGSLSEAGIQAKSILDPSAGAGQFVQDFKAVFPQSNIVAYEKDIITGKILQRLYPNEKIYAAGFETVPASNNGHFDIITSNIPFGDIAVPDTAFHLSKDPARQMAARHIHNYFFLKGIDTLREGGILAFISSQGVADAPANKSIREWLMHNADLISAIRLPNNLFLENAGTEAGSDLIVLQKNTQKTALSDNEKLFIENTQTKSGIGINKYIYNRVNLIFTDVKTGTDMYGKTAIILIHNGGVPGIAEDLGKNLARDFSERLNLDLYRQHVPASQIAMVPAVVNQELSKQQPPSSEPLLTLYDLFGLSPQERSQVNRPKRNAIKQAPPVQPTPVQIPQPTKYTGKIDKYHKPGTLVKNEQEVGVLSVDESDNFFFNPLSTQDKDKTTRYIDVRDA